MHFVTLTSDWNNDDFYTGAIKGKLLSLCEKAEIVTISNKIKPFNVAEAAFVIRNTFHHFPKGTIHIISVGSDPAPDARHLLAKIDQHYFLTADNGLISLIGDSESNEVMNLPKLESDESSSFPTLSVFTKAACQIISGEELASIGEATDNYLKQIPLRATLENNTITGTVIFIDSFGNAITNISKDLFERIGKDRSFEIYVQSKHYKITKLNRVYSDTGAGDLLALFSSVGLLEIAIRNGSAKELLHLNTDSTVRVEFK